LLQQAFDRGRSLRTDGTPVGQAILGDAKAFFLVGRDRVVEPEALDESTVTAGALVGDHDVEERAGLGAAARESNDDHCLYPWVGEVDESPDPPTLFTSV